MKGRLLQFSARDTPRAPLTPVWRLASGVECHAEQLADGRMYVEVRKDGTRQCSGLFRDRDTAVEWATEAQACFRRYWC